MEKILKKALESTGKAEVFYGDYRTAEVSYENGKLKTVSSVRMTGAGLRLIKDGRLGYASTTDFSQSDRLVTAALDTAAAGPRARFDFPGDPGKIDSIDSVKERATKLGISEMVEMGAKYVEKLKKLAPDCYPDTSITVEHDRTRILNSSGLDYESEGAMYHVYFGATVIKGSDVLMVPAFKIPLEDEYDPELAAEEAAEKIRMAEKVVEAKTGPTTVLFSPMGLDSMLMALGAGFNGKYVELGVSPIKGLTGTKALSDKLTVWNDPTVRYWYRSGALDQEGIRTEKRALIREGVIGEPYYDLLTADMYGRRSTGSGYRNGFEAPPSPSVSLMAVEPGDKEVSEMLASMEEGLYVDFCLGAGQGNVLAGEFSNNIGLGYKVEGGKIVGRVKNLMIAGNAYDALKDNIISVGSRRGFSMTMCLAPHVLVDKVSVTAKK
ncbi:MAG TPA: TldD/PmbA family protein [Bacillota bacterium]|nr:TldD/PmbA family protein [Bacillota bacterium]